MLPHTESDNAFHAQYLEKMFENSKIYQNYKFILTKVQNDGYLKVIFNVVNRILNKETSYAIQELCKIKMSNSKIDIKELFTKNIRIFKENLNLIIVNSVNQLLELKLKSMDVDKLIQQHNGDPNKGLEAIQEEEEEEDQEEKRERLQSLLKMQKRAEKLIQSGNNDKKKNVKKSVKKKVSRPGHKRSQAKLSLIKTFMGPKKGKFGQNIINNSFDFRISKNNNLDKHNKLKNG